MLFFTSNKCQIKSERFLFLVIALVFPMSIFRVFTVQPRQPQGIVQWSYYIVLLPFRFFYSTLLDVIRFACKYGFLFHHIPLTTILLMNLRYTQTYACI